MGLMSLSPTTGKLHGEFRPDRTCVFGGFVWPKKRETFVKVVSRYFLGCFGETNGLKFQKSLSRFMIVIYEWTS